MAEKILMLALSPTMEKGHLAKWLKNEGDRVASGDVLCEVETDKATMDYESPADGILLKIVAAQGSEASVGDLIAIIGDEGEDISALLEEAPAASPGAAAQDGPAAQDGSATSPVAAAQPGPATESKTAAPPSPAVEPAPEEGGSASDQPSAVPSAQPDGRPIRSSPLARKIAADRGVDLGRMSGSGPAGRIVKSDVERAAEQAAGAASRPPDTQKPEPTPPDGLPTASEWAGGVETPSGEDRVVAVSTVRRIIAKRLAESKYSAPHYYLKVTVEADAMLAARSELNKKTATKVSMNAFFLKFAAEALRRHRRVNASWNGETITEHGSIDIGLAVAQEDGLITPVVRNCSGKGIVRIDRELAALIDKARSGKLQPEEYSGATFTISNLGSYGIDEFTAIINPPGSAILAIGAIRRQPVVQPDDSLAIRSLMSLTLSCDHRVIDGAVGALFLKDLKEYLESPIKALY